MKHLVKLEKLGTGSGQTKKDVTIGDCGLISEEEFTKIKETETAFH
jgi:hypothetical protein